jgi:hypothetical protein
MNLLKVCEHCNEHIAPIIFWDITSLLDDLYFHGELSYVDLFTSIGFLTAVCIFIPHNNVAPPHESTYWSLYTQMS